MASDKRLVWELGFVPDKNGLDQVKKMLTEITNAAKEPGAEMNKELQSAATAASQLKGILHKAWNSELGQLNLNKMKDAINSTYGSVGQLKTALTQCGDAGTRAFNGFASQVLNTNLHIKKSSKLLNDMATTFSNTVRYGISSSVFNRMANEISRAYDFSVQLDKSLNDIRIVTDKSANDMAKFAVQANKAAKAMGASTRDYTEASLIYFQQGLSDEEVKARTDVTIKAANVTAQATADVSEQLTAVWNGYKVSADEAELYIDKLAKVAADTAADLNELSVGMSKVASAANNAGVDIDQMNAMLATVVSVTREAPETIGTSFRTLFARMGDLKLGATDEDGIGLGKVSSQLDAIGVKVLDQQGNMRNMGDVIEDLAAKWQTLTQAQQQAAAVAIGGKMQYSRLIALMDNWDMYTKTLETSRNAAGELQKEQDIYMQSTEAHLQKLKTEAERTYNTLFDMDVVNGFADSLTGLLGVFNGFLESLGGGTNVVLFFGSTLARVFSEQIGRGIETQIENVEAFMANLDAMKVKQDLTDTIVQDYAAQGINLDKNSVRVQTEVEYAQKILSVKKTLTNEEYEQLTAVQKRIALNEELLLNAKNYKKHLREAGVSEKADLAVIQDKAKKSKEQIKSYQQQQIELEKIRDILIQIEDENNSGERESAGLQIIDIPTDEEMSLFKEKLVDMLSSGASLDDIWKEMDSTYFRINSNLEEQEKIYNNLNTAAEKKVFLESQQKKEIEAANEEMKKFVDDTVSQKNRQSAIQESIRLVSSLTTSFMTASSIFKTANDATLSMEEKISRMVPLLLSFSTSFFPMLISLPKTLLTISSAMKLIDAATLKAASSAGIFSATLWSALAPILVLAAAVAAAIAGIVVITKSAIENYNKTANAAKAAAEEAENVANAYQECKKAAEDLKKSVANYTDGVQALDKLTKGTDEYKKALEKANEQAKELIEKYKWIAGVDYIVDENGLIRFDISSGNVLNDKQSELESKSRQLQFKSLSSSARADSLNRKKSDLNFQRTTGIDKNSDIEKKWAFYERLFYFPLIAPGIGATLAKNSSEYRGYNIDDNELRELYNGFANAETDFATILNQSDESIKNWIMNNESFSESLKKDADLLIKNKGALLDWLNATKENKDEVSQYSKNILYNAITEDTNFQSRIEKLSGDNKEIEALIKNALVASKGGQEGLQGNLEIDVENARIRSEEIESNKDLKNLILDKKSIDLSGLGITRGEDISDTALIEAYLKLKGYSNLDIQKMDISQKSGKVNATWTEKGTDALGETHEAKQSILSESDLKNIRKSVAYDLVMGADTKLTLGSLYTKNYWWAPERTLDTIEKMHGSTGEFNKKYGIDINNIIENSMAGRSKNGQMGILDFTSAFDVLSDEKIDELIKLTPEGLAKALHMTEEDFKNLGYTSLSAFEQIFDQGLFEQTRKKMLELMSDITYYGQNANNLSESDFNKLSTSISDNMSSKEMSELSKSPNALKQIDFSSTDYDKITGQLKYLAQAIKKATSEGINLTENQKEQAKDLKYSEKALKLYAEAIQRDNKALKDNDKATVDLALANVRMNNGIKTLASNFEDWHNVLKDGNKESGEYYEALANLKEAMEQALGVEVSLSFLENEENLDKMKQLAEGNVEVFDELHEAAMQDYIAHLDIVAPSQEETDAIRNDILGMVNDINSQATIEFGTELDPSYVDKLNEMLEKGQITEKQMNNILGGIGYSPTVHYKSVLGPETVTKHQVAAMLGDKEIPIGTVIDRSQSSVQVPVIEGGHNENGEVEGTGPVYVGAPSSKNINFSNTTGGKKSSGGGGGSSKNKAEEKENKDEINRYQKINSQLQIISNTLSDIEKKKSKAFGADYIKELNKELNALNQQLQLTDEKLNIQKDEQRELQQKLGAQGLIFAKSVEGEEDEQYILNYQEIWNAKHNNLNNTIALYNKMSEEEQQAFKKTLEAVQDDWQNFTKDIQHYDTLLNDLHSSMSTKEDIRRKEIAENIEKFNLEIEIRLDMMDAAKDWDSFRRDVLDDWNELWDKESFSEGYFDNKKWKSNLIRTAKEDFDLLNAYFNKEFTSAADGSKIYGSGLVKAQTEHLSELIGEAQKAFDKNTNGLFEDEAKTAMDNLKNYKEQAMNTARDIKQKIEDIKAAYLGMLKEASEKFDEQADMFERVEKFLEHDAKLIKLIYGENQYESLEKYYQKQHNNNIQQLDFAKGQVDFWKKQMDLAAENSDEWKYAKEQWLTALDDASSKLEEAVELAKEKWENAIDSVFEKMDRKFTNGLGLDYIKEEWSLINKNADEYLDSINSAYGIQKLQNKYLDAIDNTSNVGNQRKLNDLMNSEISSLQQIDRLTQTDLDRAELKYQIALKQMELEEAQSNKTSMRLRRDAQGNYSYQFVANNDDVNKAKEELEDLKNQLYNFDLKAYRENLDKAATAYEEYMSKMAEAAKIVDPTERAAKEKLIQEEYLEYIGMLQEENERYRLNLIESAIDEQIQLNQLEKEDFINATDEKINKVMNDLVPQWDSGVQQMMDKWSGPGGFKDTTEEAIDALMAKDQEYKQDLDEIQRVADVDFNAIYRTMEDTRLNALEPYIATNDELLSGYEKQVEYIRDTLIPQLGDLQDEYWDLIKVIEEANRLQGIESEKAAEKAKEAREEVINNTKPEEAKPTVTPEAETPADNQNNVSKASSEEGDGRLDIGDNVTYTGGPYYETSYGEGKHGTRGPGKLVKVTGIASGRPYPIHVKSSDSAYGWLREDQLTGYDTGGYTGEWGTNGRLAMLHQKELVLNAEDTNNFLNALEIMRNIVGNIGSDAFARLAAIGGNRSLGEPGAGIEQNVVINADFPNVTDHNEIQQAFDNLMNIATQRVNRNRI